MEFIHVQLILVIIFRLASFIPRLEAHDKMFKFSAALCRVSDIEMRTPQGNEDRASLMRDLLGSRSHNDPYSCTYYDFLLAQIKAFDVDGRQGSQSFASILDLSVVREPQIFVEEVMTFIRYFGHAARKARGKKELTLDGILSSAMTDRGRDMDSLGIDPDTASRAYQVSFAITGWLSLLYEPSKIIKPGLLSMVCPDQPSDIVLSRNVGSAKRPLAALLSEFGQSLPAISPDDVAYPLHVTALSFHALAIVGKVRVIWSLDICAHLKFDTSHRTLTMFKLPSYAAMCCLYGDPCGLGSE
jgi:hypothetical protein